MKRPADTLIAAEIDRSPIPPISDAERRAASLFVCAAADDVDDARLLLDALGLLDAPVTSVLPVRQIRPSLRRKS